MNRKIPCFSAVALLFLLLLNSCAPFSGERGDPEPEKKFRQVFSWGHPQTEEEARKYSEIGVTDIVVANENQARLAVKYNMIPYCGAFFPCGPHKQVMTEEEEKLFAYITGEDLKQLSRGERARIVDARRMEKQHRYGGEPAVFPDVLNGIRLPCFLSDEGLVLSKKRIDALFAKVPSARGIYLDFFGYNNFKDCRCGNCTGKFEAAKRKNPALSRGEFFRDALVDYYNAVIGYVKKKHPGARVHAHIYPTFLAEPLYGNRTKTDFCAQTVAWYFPWEKEKIARYTKIVVGEAEKYHRGVKGIPFVGLKALPGTSLAAKSPALLEEELKTILASGGDALSVCNGFDMIKPGYYEVFRKYCGK